jgi:hypothetical protein
VAAVAIGVVGVLAKLNSTDREQADTPAVAAVPVTPQVTLQFLCTRRVTNQVQDHLQFHIR